MVDRDKVRGALRADDVAHHLGIKGHWRGRWLRASRCAVADHGSDAFGLARDGMWHCWACDTGGDLLALLALGEGISIRTDFPRVLEIAAKIAGLDEDDFGGGIPEPRARPAPPPQIPNAERVSLARKRAAWVWERLYHAAGHGARGSIPIYLRARGLNAEAVLERESLREAPIMLRDLSFVSDDLERLRRSFGVQAMMIPVRSPLDGALVDIRARRYEPRMLPDGTQQPKIVGMLGGVTALPEADGRARQLIGCYGYPHAIDSDLVVVCEGALDYLTALTVWPQASVLGAVDAGSLALVAKHAADALAARDDTSRLLIVEQNDGLTKAADRSVNEDPNSACKVAVRKLGTRRVGWLFCDLLQNTEDDFGGGEPIKDLNDMVCAGADPAEFIRWWSDLGEVA